MRTGNEGLAREVAPGRLANFEDDEDSDLQPTLPPRPRRTATPPPAGPAASPSSAASKPARKTAQRPAPAPAPAPQEPTPQEPGTPEPGTPEPGTKGPEHRVRASNVHIPVALVTPIGQKKAAEGLSNGEIIISAIEATYAQLENLIDPAPTAGGSVFEPRRSHPSRASDGPLTPLNYRLREADFATLDRLVERFHASSRSHLISVALAAYFNPS